MPEKFHPNHVGKLLVADPSLRQGVFQKSVILLADHEEKDGCFGLILNNPAGKTVGDYLKEKEFSPLASIQVHVGGPVSTGTLTFAAFWQKGKGFQYATRISANDAIEKTQQHGTLVRAFVGYSGWDAGQLENELKQSSWIVIPPTLDLLGQSHDRGLWSQLLRPISPYHEIIAEAPDNPLMN